MQRYLPLVFHAALRRVGGDTHRAEDVTQLVFTALARDARTLARRPDLTGWLFVTTRFLAAKALRGERRRQLREHTASLDQPAMTHESGPEASPPLHAVLDDVMMELRELDRQVLLLRFHRGLRLADIGTQLGATENAVQKRVDRALEQLKDKLTRRGITSTAAALAVAFEQQGAIAMPAGLGAASLSAGLACGAGAGAGGLLAVSSFMMISKLQLGLAAAVVAATSAGLVWEARENAQLREEVAHQTAARSAETSELQKQLAALTQRATAAEADAAKLQQAMQTARTAQSAAAPRGRVLTDHAAETNAAMNHAGKLAQEGKFQEALDEYLKLYRSLEGARGMPYQQIVMSGIQRVGRTYPPAVAALRELRDTAMRRVQASSASREVVSEIGYLNERLGDGAATIALYDALPAGDPGRQSLALTARESFVAARRYADALVGTPFGSMLSEFEMMARSTAKDTGQSLVNTRGFAMKGALTNLEVLFGAGRLDEARILTEKILAFDGSDATRAAIKQRAERAGQSITP